MAFWELHQPLHAVALIDHNGRPHTYAALSAATDDVASRLRRYPVRDVGFILFEAHVDSIATYLGALRSGVQVPLLLQPSMNGLVLKTLVDIYRPGWIAAATNAPIGARYCLDHDLGGYGLFRRDENDAAHPHPECGLLLSTSGSTGSPKLVRLSYRALAHNADSIVRYLGLNSDDRAITTLPLAYSFGMSILNSHLAAGASLTLTSHSILTKEFWHAAATSGVTSLSGVPSTFEMLRRAGIERRGLSRIRMLTQAGGRLSDELTRYLSDLARQSGWSFFVMYGQTEAAPRISYVPPHRLPEKIGSIGLAIPGGAVDIDPSSGELVYSGPNVMMGYALSRDDLRKPDECHGVLRTGNLGRRDEEGFVYLTGRLKRFVKLSGSRVSLDEVETALSKTFAVTTVCIGQDDQLTVVLQADAAIGDAQVYDVLRGLFNVYSGLVRLVRVKSFPQLENGKLDYSALQVMAAQP